jgi:hypothetical protein
MNWLRIISYAIILLAVGSLISLASTFTMSHWDMSDSTINIAFANIRLVRRLTIGIAATLLYWQFGRNIAVKRFMHFLAVFFTYQLLDIIFTATVFNITLQELFDPWSFLPSLVAAIIGYCLCLFSAQRSASLQSKSVE